MKPINYMELLGDLPEDLIDCAFLTVDSAEQQAQNGQAIRQTKGEETVKEHGANRKKPASFRLGRAGLAAAITLCIGLNAALIYGIIRMKTSPISTSSTEISEDAELQDLTKPFMEIDADKPDPTPNCIMIKIVNPVAPDDTWYNPVFIVTQNGKKIADCEITNREITDRLLSEIEILCTLRYEPLPSGSYTLVNLADDGESEGILGHLDFEIPEKFDSMVWFPKVVGMQYEKAAALLAEKDFDPVIKLDIYDSPILNGSVTYQKVPPYKIVQKGGVLHSFYYDNENGYWVNPDDEIELHVHVGPEGDPTTVPNIRNMSWENAKTVLENYGLKAVKRRENNNKVPFGQLISIDPKPGTEVTVGSKVQVTVSLGPELSVDTPNLSGMDWEKAKQTTKEAGIQPIRILTDSNEYPAGTVVGQSDLFRNTSNQDLFIVLYVAKKENEQDIAMKFNVSGYYPKKYYYFYLQNEAGEILGATLPFSTNMTLKFTKEYLYPDCTEDNTKVTAILADWETKQEVIAGSYILHPETGTYDIISEDIEAACKALYE